MKVTEISKMFRSRVSDKDGFDKELRVIQLKTTLGVLEKPEDSYMWPYLLEVWDKFAPKSGISGRN